MKKLSLILAGSVLFGSLSFASHVVKQDAKAPVAQQKAKPIEKPKAKPVVKPTKGTKEVHYKKPAPVNNTTK